MTAEQTYEEEPIMLYTVPDGRVMVKAPVKDMTIWMTHADAGRFCSAESRAIVANMWIGVLS